MPELYLSQPAATFGSGDLPAGVWELEGAGRREKLHINCPHCGALVVAWEHGKQDGAINVDGEVMPALSCRCGWDDFLILVGWKKFGTGPKGTASVPPVGRRRARTLGGR